MDGYVSKPIEAEELFKTLESLVEQIGTQPGLSETEPAEDLSSRIDWEAMIRRVGRRS